MNISKTVAIGRYKRVRDELNAKYPEQWDEVVKLCSLLPDKIDTAAVWRHGKDKPCWSNIRVASGAKIAADIKRSEDFNSFEIIASDDWDISMREQSLSWRKNENFELRGQAVQQFIGRLSKGGLSSYLWKLFAIRNLAISLTKNSRVQEMVRNLPERDSIPSDELKKWTESFSEQVGMGWGVVTVYHMLTNLGLAIKPDMHLKRSAIRMGLLAPQIPSYYPESDFNKVNDHEIVRTVIDLSKLITPTAGPENPRSALREVDKVLMEWSRQELHQPL